MCIYIYLCVYICVYKCIKYANYIPIYYQHIPIIYPSYYTTYAGETAYQLQLHSHVIFPPLMVKSVKSLFIQLLFFPSNHIESTGPKEQASLHHFFDEGHDAFGDYTNICYQYLFLKKKNITVGGFPTKITRCSHDFNFHDHSKPLLASWRLSGIASRRNLIHRHMGNAHGWK